MAGREFALELCMRSQESCTPQSGQPSYHSDSRDEHRQPNAKAEFIQEQQLIQQTDNLFNLYSTNRGNVWRKSVQITHNKLASTGNLRFSSSAGQESRKEGHK